jgi:hypothetical protein
MSYNDEPPSSSMKSLSLILFYARVQQFVQQLLSVLRRKNILKFSLTHRIRFTIYIQSLVKTRYVGCTMPGYFTFVIAAQRKTFGQAGRSGQKKKIFVANILHVASRQRKMYFDVGRTRTYAPEGN